MNTMIRKMCYFREAADERVGFSALYLQAQKLCLPKQESIPLFSARRIEAIMNSSRDGYNIAH